MKATPEAINLMQAEGVICHYAIGGAVAAVYYAEPATVLEIDVFVILPFDPNGSSASLTTFHDHLIARGWEPAGECFELGGWPVRFLVTDTDLKREAVASSIPIPLDSYRVWVVTAEHLIAIALTAKRSDDRPWMLRLVERDAIDELMLKAILSAPDLIGKWTQFEHEFPPRFPSKEEMRNRMAALSFSQKIETLEKLRDRQRAIADARRATKGSICRQNGS